MNSSHHLRPARQALSRRLALRGSIAAVAVVLRLLPSVLAQQPNEPQPPEVTPAATCGQPPSDAVVLFDGADLSNWTIREGRTGGWKVADGAIISSAVRTKAEPTGTWDLISKQTFTDAQIHVEFAIPDLPGVSGQAKGNSGVYLQGRYELQVLDSYQNPTYPKGLNGALYGSSAPLVNASRPPTQWQTYDIVFHAPKCNADGTVAAPGSLTVLLNGVLIQDSAPVKPRRQCVADPGPLLLQDHYHPDVKETPIRFRNIWLRRIAPRE